MHFRQFYLESLGHASYLVGDTASGEAMVLDPRRDVDVYLDAALEAGLQIRHVIDSHQHNDYLSGVREIVERAGATALGSANADLGYDHQPVKDGHEFEIGDVGITVLHTPGHTPEHIALLLRDGEQSGDQPAILLSGGSLLVGDLARPDLLGGEEVARQAATVLCHTIRDKILALPDHVLVYPTHVAGSLCGGSIGSRLVTTVGYERATNEILRRASTTDQFVEQCMDVTDLPAVPPYWRRIRGRNQEGPALLGVVDAPPARSVSDIARHAGGDGVVLDTRDPEAFAGGHVPGAINVGLGASFATWAGSVLPAEARVALVVHAPPDVVDATWQLLRIGYDRPVGWLAGGMRAWRTAGRDVASLDTATVHDIGDRLEDVHVLDVRQPAEWNAGHAPGAQFITGATLRERLAEVPRDRDVVVMCGSGYRSSVAASLLQRDEHERVTNLLGGMAAWVAAGLPTVRT